jgi:hypothetical protein
MRIFFGIKGKIFSQGDFLLSGLKGGNWLVCGNKGKQQEWQSGAAKKDG